ncbi:MAG: Mov34/MPN/PAD-1 family protein [bacterium]|nr:Mov34/MPN/PAD-1 family protein [bacterium]
MPDTNSTKYPVVNSVLIQERALLSMVLSCIEVYHHEALGLLLGHIGIDKYIVEYAIPYQTAMKGYSWVAPKSNAADRMNKILKCLPLSLIGDYHSHTQWKTLRGEPTPSGDDIADMECGRVYIIMAINDKVKPEPWRITENGFITGTLNEYKIDIGAYTCPADYNSKPVKIICPSALGLFLP